MMPVAATAPSSGAPMAGQRKPRSLYVSRPLANAADVARWAADAGLRNVLPPEDMHVTVAYSRDSTPWPDPIELPVTSTSGPRSVERLGDKGAVVLRFESPELAGRWQNLRDRGASWDHDGYKPHVTLTYDPGDVDPADVQPYASALEFGPERVAEVDDSWADRFKPAPPGGDSAPNAAGVVFISPGGRALFLRRSSSQEHPGEWAWPAGGIEAGEDAKTAARRECQEEIGRTPGGDLAEVDRRAIGGVDFVTLVEPVEDEFDPRLNAEHVEYVWAPLSEPPQPLHPGVAATLEADRIGDALDADADADADVASAFQRSEDDFERRLLRQMRLHPSEYRGVVGADASREAEHTATIKFNGDFDLRGLLRHLHRLGAIGASRSVTAQNEDDHPVNFGWDGDGADKIVSAEIDGADALAEDASAVGDVEIDRDHDGPWMSCMSIDGRRMYVNKNVPPIAEIEGEGDVDVDERLLHHEVPERADIEEQLREFKAQHGREPNDEERKEIYLRGHRRSGVPGERKFVVSQGGSPEKWNAWCRGIEAKVEKGPFENQPEDADVKPIPHHHNDLEAVGAATDSALRMPLALDKDSVRQFDLDGRMHVHTAHIAKACVSPYLGSEIPNYEALGLEPGKIYRLLRDPEELRKSVPTWNRIQLLRKHEPVSADDHRPFDIAGTTGSDTTYNHPFLDNSLAVWSSPDIKGIEDKSKFELSPGYHYVADMTPGTWAETGEDFDGVMREIVGNHLCIVEDGRQGKQIVVPDSIEEFQWAAIERAILELGANA